MRLVQELEGKRELVRQKEEAKRNGLVYEMGGIIAIAGFKEGKRANQEECTRERTTFWGYKAQRSFPRRSAFWLDLW